MTNASFNLSDAAKELLEFHRLFPGERKCAIALEGRSKHIRSREDLLSAYAELVEQHLLVPCDGDARIDSVDNPTRTYMTDYRYEPSAS